MAFKRGTPSVWDKYPCSTHLTVILTLITTEELPDSDLSLLVDCLMAVCVSGSCTHEDVMNCKPTEFKKETAKARFFDFLVRHQNFRVTKLTTMFVLHFAGAYEFFNAVSELHDV